ncbi:MAG TPA: histidinol dehydrogenase [Sphingomicrobium sp.]|nr:histidinol dehydrogenase [Sphingomicrobium sp.]
MKRLVWNDLSGEDRALALARPTARNDPALIRAVRAIVDDVRNRGWDALCDHAKQLDGHAPARIATAPLAQKARKTLLAEQLAALKLAARNIEKFHKSSLPQEQWCETSPGIRVGKIWRPVERVGLYIPGGVAPLFSTLLMLAIPARVAGVSELIVTTPPVANGGLNPVIALAAELCGISHVWTAGGAQAIAALAFGAGEIPRVDKICGPGNAYVAAAKSYVTSLAKGPAIDLPAGPSELLIIADDSADPKWVAADLLSQAEHDSSAQVLLVTPSTSLADEAEKAVLRMLPALPRAAIATGSLEQARIIVAEDLGQAIDIANLYAPEHLSLAVFEAEKLLSEVMNAGAIFVGHGAAESFGDYLSGPSHVLPTDGAARAWSGVSAFTYLKSISVHELSDRGILTVASAAASLARMEGLEAHARAADVRVGSLA